jgi:excisionase family DNA binding protein
VAKAKGNKGQPTKGRNWRKPAPVAPILTFSDLWNYAQAAQFLGVAQGTLENWVSSGLYALPHVRVGRLIRFRPSSLSRWLASRERNVDQLEASPATEATVEAH